MKVQKTLLVSMLSFLTGITLFAPHAMASKCLLSQTQAFENWAQIQKVQAVKCLQVELQQTLDDIQQQQTWIDAELQNSRLGEEEKMQLEKSFYQTQVSKEDETLRIELLIKSLQKN